MIGHIPSAPACACLPNVPPVPRRHGGADGSRGRPVHVWRQMARRPCVHGGCQVPVHLPAAAAVQPDVGVLLQLLRGTLCPTTQRLFCFVVFFFVNLIIFGVNLINFYFQFPGVFSHAHTHRNILRTVFKLMKGCGITTMGRRLVTKGGGSTWTHLSASSRCSSFGPSHQARILE